MRCLVVIALLWQLGINERTAQAEFPFVPFPLLPFISPLIVSSSLYFILFFIYNSFWAGKPVTIQVGDDAATPVGHEQTH